MTKFLVLSLLALLSVSAFAEGDQPKHIISIGTDGLGWSGLSDIYKWDKDDSGIKDHTKSEGNLKLNYNYVFASRLMLGVDISSTSSKEEIKTVAGTKTTDETSETRIGLSLGYNFNEDLFRSWWIKGTLGSGSYKNRTKDSTGTDKTEYGYSFVTFSGGKRISLESWGLKNFSYSPSISISSAKVDGDAHDAGLDSIAEVKFDIIKLDILF